MLQAKISFSKIKKTVFVFGIVNFVVYVILFLVFKYLNFLNITSLWIVNYVTLTLISLYQVHKLVKQSGGYVPFLQTFCMIFFTGSWSFILFGIFIFIYAWFDPYLNQLFDMDADSQSRLVSAILVFFEGSGASIIIALIAMFYSSRYEDGEATI
jgi:hypothetical protein